MGRLRRRQDGRPRRLWPVFQHHQPAEPDRHRHQPAGHAAAGHRQPDVPDAGLQPRRRDLDAAGAVRSRQSADPRVQRQPAARALVSHGADRRLRRLARPPSAPQRRRQHGATGRPGRRHRVHPRRHAAPEHGFSTIELKSSDGESWYNALIIDVRRRLAGGVRVQSSYTLSKSEDTTQASTFFSDATNGTTSAMPEYIAGYNKGPSDFDTRHNWVASFSWELPFAKNASPVARAFAAGWQVSGIWLDAQRTAADRVRDGKPFALAVEPVARPGDRSGPAQVTRRATTLSRRSTAHPNSGSIPRHSPCSPQGRSATPAAATSSGPTCARSTSRSARAAGGPRSAPDTRVEFRVEVFNVLNRANFGVPELRAFAGQADGEAPLATFGRISNTVTSSRQMQISARIDF